jgi:hypothetical protein
MRKRIHALRGSIKFDTGGKSFSEWMADLNREEKELEEAKFIRMERAWRAQRPSAAFRKSVSLCGYSFTVCTGSAESGQFLFVSPK